MNTIYVYSHCLNNVAVLLHTLNYYFSRSEEPLWCGFEPLSGFSLDATLYKTPTLWVRTPSCTRF